MPADTVVSQNTGSHALRLPHPGLAESSFFASGREIRVLTDDRLAESCHTRIAFTMRHGGVSASPFNSLNLSFSVGDDPSNVERNRLLLDEAMGAGEFHDRLICPLQVHGVDILAVDDVTATRCLAQEGADGIVCTLLNVPVLLCFADCVPVILVAPDGSFAVLHAGWRGAFGGIPGLGLGMLSNATGCQPSEVNCYIGPHIESCCYEFDEGLLRDFVNAYGDGCDAGGKHLDLTQAVTSSLLGNGASEERIAAANACTSCNIDAYFSHRAENGKTGRHGAYAIRKEASWD